MPMARGQPGVDHEPFEAAARRDADDTGARVHHVAVAVCGEVVEEVSAQNRGVGSDVEGSRQGQRLHRAGLAMAEHDRRFSRGLIGGEHDPGFARAHPEAHGRVGREVDDRHQVAPRLLVHPQAGGDDHVAARSDRRRGARRGWRSGCAARRPCRRRPARRRGRRRRPSARLLRWGDGGIPRARRASCRRPRHAGSRRGSRRRLRPGDQRRGGVWRRTCQRS